MLLQNNYGITRLRTGLLKMKQSPTTTLTMLSLDLLPVELACYKWSLLAHCSINYIDDARCMDCSPVEPSTEVLYSLLFPTVALTMVSRNNSYACRTGVLEMKPNIAHCSNSYTDYIYARCPDCLPVEPSNERLKLAVPDSVNDRPLMLYRVFSPWTGA